MAVLQEKRSESELKFLMTARELMIYTIRSCKNDKIIPKRYNDMGQIMIRAAADIYGNAKSGNTVNPLNQHEVQIRRDYFIKALASVEKLASYVEIMYEVLQFEMKKLEEWSRLLAEEERLLRGCMKKDRERYKNITA